MIVFDHVSKHYAHQVALSDISFVVDKGEMVFLTGHSGAGKSTVIRLAMGLETISRGQIMISGQNVGRLKSSKQAKLRQSIGVILQDPCLLDGYNVFDNVALPLLIQGMSGFEIKKRVAAALGKVDLRDIAHQMPAELSAGEQQRVGIARAIINKPSIILADEPTGNLDPHLSQEIFALFAAFQEVGVTVMVATHDLSLIASMPERIITLKAGAILHQSHEMGI